MCVCGVIGYAHTTSGRQRATLRATAREPSSWSRMRAAGLLRQSRRGLPRTRSRAARRLPSAPRADKRSLDRGFERLDADGAGLRDEPAEQRGVRDRAPEVRARQLAGRHAQKPGRRIPGAGHPLAQLAQAEQLRAAGRVDRARNPRRAGRRTRRRGAAGSGPARPRRRARRSARAGGSGARRCGRTRPRARPSARSRSSGTPVPAGRPRSRPATAARRPSRRPGRPGRGCGPRTRAASPGRPPWAAPPARRPAAGAARPRRPARACARRRRC